MTENDRVFGIFWNDIDGIIDLLNKNDPKHTHTTIESPQVNHFLLWRILNELRVIREASPIDPELAALTFWNDEDAIIEILNKTDPKHTNTNILSPQVSHYFMWRILSELKIVKDNQKKIINEER